MNCSSIEAASSQSLNRATGLLMRCDSLRALATSSTSASVIVVSISVAALWHIAALVSNNVGVLLYHMRYDRMSMKT